MNDHRSIPASGAACARVRERLDALLDGALAPLEAARDEGHLETCAGCAAERDRAAAMLVELRDVLGAAEDRTWRDAGLTGRLATASRPRAPWHERLLGPAGDRSGAPVLAAAAAVLVLVGLGASGAVDDLTADVRSQIDVPADGELRELFDGAVSGGEGWLDGWLGGEAEEGVR